MFYDKSTNEIVLDDARIKIMKRSNSDRHVDVCERLLKDRTTLRNGLTYGEILDDWGLDKRSAADRMKIYHIARWIEKVVYRETGKSEFVIFNTYEMKVNPKYLN